MRFLIFLLALLAAAFQLLENYDGAAAWTTLGDIIQSEAAFSDVLLRLIELPLNWLDRPDAALLFYDFSGFAGLPIEGKLTLIGKVIYVVAFLIVPLIILFNLVHASVRDASLAFGVALLNLGLAVYFGSLVDYIAPALLAVAAYADAHILTRRRHRAGIYVAD
jgi:hypothetical protein